MGRRSLLAGRRKGTLLRVAGCLVALASCVRLVMWSVAPHGVSALEAAAVALPTALVGLALVWFGSRRLGPRTHRRALRSLLDGYRQAGLLYVAAKLGLADLLADGPRSSVDLARPLGAHAPTLHRVLRGLVALGVCSEERDGRFGLGPLGTWLQAEKHGSSRGSAILNGEEAFAAWGGLLHSAMTGETAFDHVFGMSVWEHRERHPELNEYFNAAFREGAPRATAAILAAYDFSQFGTVADVGGGHGALLTAILKAHPSVNGILFDQPHVIADAGPYLEAAGVAARCRAVGGGLLAAVPAGADAHVLKYIIHNWGDDGALAILRNCHDALSDGGTLLLVERVLPARVEQDPATVWLDLHMLALNGGRERTEAEYRALLAAAGFTVTRVIRPRSSFRIIEAVRLPAGDGPHDQSGPAG